MTPVSLVLSGPPGTPKVGSASKTCINLTWTPPENDKGVPIIGYLLEKRKKDTTEWIALNDISEPIEGWWQKTGTTSQLCQLYICIYVNCLVLFPHSDIHVFSDVKYAVKEVTEGAEYEFRVSAINESGSGDPSPPSAMVCAKNPNSK